MTQVWLIARREIITMLRRPTFYVVTFLTPALVLAVFFGLSLVGSLSASVGGGGDTDVAARPSGLVDQAGVVATIPFDQHQLFIPYDDEAAAATALRNNRISSYFVIPPDYRDTGRVVRTSRQTTFTSASGPDTQALRTILRANLAGDPAIAVRLDDPLDLDTTVLDRPQAPQESEGPNTSIPYALGMILALGIINSGGWLIQAVAEEKENRTVEIVLTSVRPWQLMAGKLLGLGAMSLLQLAVWAALGGGITGAGLALGGIDVGTITPAVVGWAIGAFVLGFLLFGGLMMMLGAVGASMREVGQVSGFVTLPIMLPLVFGGPLLDDPNSSIAVGLSVFPLTAPVTMLFRLTQTVVPVWQIVASVVLLVCAVAGVIWLAARLFRSATLLTGARPTPRVLWRALRSAGS